ncbi:DUF3107 family protein, partial [Microbacterium sp. H6]|uniref:DUF3107 family protein n=1 Tax=Microbacterium sp. H6 TaxID=421122 RepID=UPI002852EEC6
MTSTLSGRADITVPTRLRPPAAMVPSPCALMAKQAATADPGLYSRGRVGAVPELQGARVEIRIGIINTGRELSFDTGASAEEVRTQVATALEQSASHVSFADVKG